MKKAHFDAIVSGLNEVKDFVGGKSARGIVHIPPEVDAAAIRRKSGLSQPEFALRMGVSVGTLRNWEQGRRVPDGPARVLLSMMAVRPNVVQETLGEPADA